MIKPDHTPIGEACEHSSLRTDQARLRLRWVTWWPVGYWIKRFNQLSKYIDLDVVFLAAKSSLLPQDLDRSSFRFKYRVLRDKEDTTGYHQVSFGGWRWPKPWALLKGRHDAIIIPYSDPSCVLVATIAPVLRTKVLLFCPNTIYDGRNKSAAREWLKRYLFNAADGVLTTGAMQYNYVKQYLHDSNRIFAVGNPAPHLPPPLETRESLRKKIQSQAKNQDSDVVIFVGRLSFEKDLNTLLLALNIIKKGSGCCPTLILVGDGPEAGALQAQATSKNLPVVFAGFRQEADLASYYAAADIFVLPSSSEPWGLVVNEAMQFGLPLVLSERVGCASALLGNSTARTGVSFAAGNPEELSERLVGLLADKPLLKTMGQNAKRLITKHTVDSWCHKVLTALDLPDHGERGGDRRKA